MPYQKERVQPRTLKGVANQEGSTGDLREVAKYRFGMFVFWAFCRRKFLGIILSGFVLGPATGKFQFDGVRCCGKLLGWAIALFKALF